jgi:Fe-Mn family superoxide dismutase
MKSTILNVIMFSALVGGVHAGNDPLLAKKAGSLEFGALPYAYDALESYIDKMTMEIHYSKHHKAYFDNVTKAVKGTEMETKTLAELFKEMSKYPMPVRNNGGGYYNHFFFWDNMAPAGTAPMSKEFEALLVKKFGSVVEFKNQFSEAAKTRFGSGWAWLSVDDKGELFVSSTPNQDNPLMDVADKKGTPILALDVWEHAYYLKYQNRRPDYIEAWWNVVNWKKVEERYNGLKK